MNINNRAHNFLSPSQDPLSQETGRGKGIAIEQLNYFTSPSGLKTKLSNLHTLKYFGLSQRVPR